MAYKKNIYENSYGTFVYKMREHRESSYFWSTITSYTAEIVDFEPKGPRAVFPSKIQEGVVTAISLPMRTWKNVTSLSFPRLRNLGLYNCSFPSLQKVEFSDNSFYTDGRMVYSYDRTKLYFSLAGREDEVIHVPEYVKTVADTAFLNSRCREIVFENPKVKIGPNAFEGSLFKDLHPAFYLGDRLMFLEKDVPLLDLPDGVKIEKEAFAVYSPQTLRASFLPELSELSGPKKIEAFELTSREASLSPFVLAADYPNLKEIRVPEDHIRYERKDGVLYDRAKSQLVYYPHCREGTCFEVPEGTRSIGAFAFQKARFLEEVRIPESVTDIGADAFSSCPNLRKVHLPSGIEGFCRSSTYGSVYGVINGCDKLQELLLPEGFKYLGTNTVYTHPSMMEDIQFPDTLEYLGAFCLPQMDRSQVHLPASLLAAKDRSLAGAKRVWAYEGTARGLVAAINGYKSTKKGDPWHRAEIIVLGPDGKEKALFYIPYISSEEGRAALIQAWDSEQIDYDAYASAFRYVGVKQTEDKLLMALLLVIDGQRRGAALDYLQNSIGLTDAGWLLMRENRELYFDRYLALEGHTISGINHLIAKSLEHHLGFFREKLLEKKNDLEREK